MEPDYTAVPAQHTIHTHTAYDTVGFCLEHTRYLQENNVENHKTPMLLKKTLSSGILLLVKAQKANANHCGWNTGDLPSSALPDMQLLVTS